LAFFSAPLVRRTLGRIEQMPEISTRGSKFLGSEMLVPQILLIVPQRALFDERAKVVNFPDTLKRA
jgi:hypothetical protein